MPTAKPKTAAATIALPSDLATQYTPPENASLDELAAMIEAARAEATALVGDDAAEKFPDVSFADRMARAEWYISAIDAVENRQGEIKTAQAAEADQQASIRDRLSGKPPKVEGEGDPKPEEEDPDEEGGDGTPPVVESGTATDPANAGAAAAPALVAGAARRSAVAAAASAGRPATPPARRTKGEAAYLTAAAGVSGVEAGQRIDWADLGRIASSRFGSLPRFKGAGPSRQPIGSLMIPTADEKLVASGIGEFVNVDDAIEWALSHERVLREAGGTAETFVEALLAAGWCAPSEVLYDLLNLSTREGMVNTPGFTVNRGGVRFSLGPDFGAVYSAGANFTQTEAQNIAAVQKPVVNIPCPSFTDNRMLVDGLYLTGDILSQKGFPEAYADFIEKAMIAFAHYVNAAQIADMETASTLVDFTAGGVKGTNSISTELLGSIELLATDLRYKQRLGETSPLELVLPLWLKGAIRSDVSKRMGLDAGEAVTDAQIEEFFTARHVNVQWVYDWQDSFTGVSGGFGSATSPTAWPVTAKYLLYPAGTFVAARSDIIDLQAVYDSTLLKTNQFVALFMEQGRLTLKRAWDARVAKVPVIVSGATALGIDYTLVANQPTV